MQKRINVLFWLNSSKRDKKGLSPIYLRITADQQRAEHYTGFKCKPSDWDAHAQAIKGEPEPEIEETFSTYVIITRAKILGIQRDLYIEGGSLTPVAILARLVGKTEEKVTLLQAFQHHNEHMRSLIGKDIIRATYNRYNVTKRKVETFLRSKHIVRDIPLDKLTVRFISEFETFLKTDSGNQQNTASKHLKILKKVVKYAITNQWLVTDPFSSYRCRTTPTERGFLSKAELQRLQYKELATYRMAAVRDAFVFACYTGLSYCDLQKLTDQHIITDDNGGEWICIKRTKTGSQSLIPLLPAAKVIIEKYRNNPECSAKGKLLPLRSNQKMNEYLNELADVCGIKKKITCHLARHTFATTITHCNGVSLEAVGSMLGHKNIRTTQIYAKMTMNRIAAEMAPVAAKV